jgi:hypothetical protein
VAEHGRGPLFRHLPKDKNGKRSTYVARKIDDWMDGVDREPLALLSMAMVDPRSGARVE